MASATGSAACGGSSDIIPIILRLLASIDASVDGDGGVGSCAGGAAADGRRRRSQIDASLRRLIITNMAQAITARSKVGRIIRIMRRCPSLSESLSLLLLLLAASLTTSSQSFDSSASASKVSVKQT